MPDCARILPFIALVVFSGMSLLAMEALETLAVAGYTPLERLSPTANPIAWGDATLQATRPLS